MTSPSTWSPRLRPALRRLHAVAVDLDGTLLSSTKTIEPPNQAALRRAAALGVRVIIATGRMTPAVTRYAEQLGIADLAMVTYNGAMAHAPDGTVVFHRPIPAHISDLVLRHCERTQRCLNVYLDQKLYASSNPSHRPLVSLYERLTGVNATGVPSYVPFLGSQPSKLAVFCEHDPDQVQQLYHELSQIVQGTEAHLVRAEFFVEVLVGGVHKGNGLAGLLSHLQIDPDHVVTFGDGENDIEFLSMFGQGIAVANAHSLAKHAASYCSPYTNDECAVGRDLDRLLDEFFPNDAATGTAPSRPASHHGRA